MVVLEQLRNSQTPGLYLYNRLILLSFDRELRRRNGDEEGIMHIVAREGDW